MMHFSGGMKVNDLVTRQIFSYKKPFSPDGKKGFAVLRECASATLRTCAEDANDYFKKSLTDARTLGVSRLYLART